MVNVVLFKKSMASYERKRIKIHSALDKKKLGAKMQIFDAGVAQLVERNLAKVDVEGSSPFSRSKSVNTAFEINKSEFICKCGSSSAGRAQPCQG